VADPLDRPTAALADRYSTTLETVRPIALAEIREARARYVERDCWRGESRCGEVLAGGGLSV